MATFDFSVKYVLRYLEYNKREKKNNLIMVAQAGGGELGYLGQQPK